MAKIYGALEVAQLEWFTDAGKPAASSYIYRVIYVSDLKQIQVSDGTNWIPFLNTSTNQTVSGNITFAGQQIFNGLHRLSVTTDSSSTGAITALNNVTPVTEFTAAVTSISGIANSASGATVMLVNRTGSTFSVLDEDAGASAANRIRTGTGAPIALANNASIVLTYVGDSRWHIVGGAGAGSGSADINYITNGSAEADTSGWATYADAAGTSPVDGTGGSPSVTLTRSTTSPLIGTASFIFTKGASNLQGQGASYDFTIDAGYKAKVLQISFNYLVDSGTFVAGSSTADSDVTVWLYDKTNNVVIQPSSYKLLSNNASIADTFNATFQTASNSTSYRLIFHVGTTSASAYTLKIDGISVSPSTYVYGTPITDWQSYTPTFTGFGTVSTQTFWWRRNGDTVQIKGRFTSGTSTAVEARISLPSGQVADSSKVNGTLEVAGFLQSGDVNASTTAGIGSSASVLIEPSITYLTFSTRTSTLQGLTKANGNSIAASGVAYSFFAQVPVQGWSSSVQTSDQTDTRVVSARIGGNPANTSANGIIIYPTVLQDTHGAYNTTTGQYRAPVPGFYQISAYINCSNPNGALYASVDGVAQAPNMGYVFNSVGSGGGYTTVYANAGQLIDVRHSQACTGFSGATSNGLTIARVSGPSAIAASETVACTYTGTATGTLTTGSTNFLATIPTKVFDTHNAYSTSTGLYTVPASGKYKVYAQLHISSIYVTGITTARCEIRQAGSATTSISGSQGWSSGASPNPSRPNTSIILNCIAGDTIAVYGGSDGSSNTYGNQCSVSIVRVGI